MALISDTTEDKQIRRTILESIESYDIEMLKRIAYECRCEEMGILPDNTYIQFGKYFKRCKFRHRGCADTIRTL